MRRNVRQLVSFVAAMLLGMQLTGCAREDIILGTGAGVAGVAGSDLAVTPPREDEPAVTAGIGSVVPQAGAATDTGAAGAAGATGTTVPAPGGARAGTGGPAAGDPAAGGADAGAAGASATFSRATAGCGKAPALPDASIELTSGMRANYILDLPGSYDITRAYPLVMAFRATDMTTDEFRTALNLQSAMGTEGIAIYPDFVDDAASWEPQRDIPLFDELLSKVKSNYCVDEGRVFVVGHGSGASFVNWLGCVRTAAVRAVAPLSAAARPGPCTGETAAWILQGNVDINLRGLGRANRDFWAIRNACDVWAPLPVGPSTCVEYAGCRGTVPVRYCEFDGDGLPSFTASGMWNFFEAL